MTSQNRPLNHEGTRLVIDIRLKGSSTENHFSNEATGSGSGFRWDFWRSLLSTRRYSDKHDIVNTYNNINPYYTLETNNNTT